MSYQKHMHVMGIDRMINLELFVYTGDADKRCQP